IMLGAGAVVVVLLVLLVPTVKRMLSTDTSVSASRLSFATVERGPFVRDIAADGRVVAAISPTLYAASNGAVVLKVNAGDAVKKGQVLAVIDSPELTNQLAQEESNADGMQVDYERAQIALRHANADMGLDNDSLGFEVKAKKLAWDRQKLLVQDLQRQVDDLNVRSPVNGQVGQLFIAPTATVAKDAKLLSVIDLSAL